MPQLYSSLPLGLSTAPFGTTRPAAAVARRPIVRFRVPLPRALIVADRRVGLTTAHEAFALELSRVTARRRCLRVGCTPRFQTGTKRT